MTLRGDIQIGAHRMLWTVNGGSEVDLGYTAEGSEITIKETQLELEADELTAPFDAVIVKHEIIAKGKLLQLSTTTLATVLNAIRTSVVGPPAGISVDMDPRKGTRAGYGTFIFRPRDLTSSDKSKDKTFWNAIAVADGMLPLKASAMQTIDFNFKAGAHQSSDNWKMFTIGDPVTGKVYAL